MIAFIKEIEPMCEVQGGSFCCRKSVASIQKGTFGFF